MSPTAVIVSVAGRLMAESCDRDDKDGINSSFVSATKKYHAYKKRLSNYVVDGADPCRLGGGGGGAWYNSVVSLYHGTPQQEIHVFEEDVRCVIAQPRNASNTFAPVVCWYDTSMPS